MTKEISKEVAAKVYGLYLGAEVLVSDPFNPNDPLHAERLVGVINDPEEQFLTVFDQHSRRMYYFKDFDPQLILSDLSDISEADARDVCRMLRLECPSNAMLSRQVRNDPQYRTWTRFSYMCQYHELDEPEEKVIINFTKNDLHGVGVRYFEDYLKAIDFLRSRSYMLPAHGIQDLFEAGIAVRKETIKK